ncbi:MAG: carbohydrate ABC transporter permease [Ruminococcus sp.]|nr:carbohydrate ABC transporter permease [Ruminococcus sp.]
MTKKTDSPKLRASNRQAGKKYGGTVCIFIFLAVLGAFMVFPIYIAVVMSIKPVEELFIFPPKLYAVQPTLENFRDMFLLLRNGQVPFSRYAANSVLVTVSITGCQCIFSSMAAFVLAKCCFPGQKLINSLIVTALLYQSSVIYIMQYIVLAKLHLIDTPAALIFPSIASPMGLFLMRQAISQMPDEIIEAAKADGAGIFRICWQIVIPNQKPALMTLIIFAFQSAWSLQSGSFVFSEELKTLPTVVQQAAASGLARAGAAMAAAVFMLIPPAVVFIIAQKNVIRTMAHSGIKQ